MSMVVLLCAALTVSLIALCYADLSSRFTGSGAAWLYSYNAFGRFTGGYVVIIVGMPLSIFGVAFAGSFNTPLLLSSLSHEHNLLPSWIGKKNKHDAP